MATLRYVLINYNLSLAEVLTSDVYAIVQVNSIGRTVSFRRLLQQIKSKVCGCGYCWLLHLRGTTVIP